ncbi:proline-rich protein 23A3-like [Microtus oregoni]|uniref:proline-rich protein 23A3-like n=1 Tax=Microtus oregoni TaxID=111838 RepID=UPI001BB27E2C|nr:proline-rich protein 23A3-like [Microtus oregoni]
MLNMQPSSSDTDPAPYWTPQPQGPSPARRRRLHEPQGPLGLEEPAASTSNVSNSMVILVADCALQLQLDGIELLLEPDATSVLEVELPENTIILVPEGLQASHHLGQPGFFSANPQGDAVLEMPVDHLLVLQPGSSCQFILESSYQEESYDEDEDSGSLSRWMDPPAGQAKYSLGYWKAQPTLLGGASELEARGAEPSVTFHDLTFRSNTGDLIDVLVYPPNRAVHMLNMQPSSSDTDPAPYWTPQPQGPSPAKRCRLHEPQGPLGLEEPATPTSYVSTSTVILVADCAVQLQLDFVELLLEPDAT